MTTPRVAVVGSGPSGLYTVIALLVDGRDLHIDVLDRLPTPYGLVRYGVAPDHAKMKAVTRVLAKPFATDRVRFLGNVEIGRDLDHDELLELYDAVVYAAGAEVDSQLGITGEELPGTIGSAEFVRWYNGHPDASDLHIALDTSDVVVVGAGNVALDVARFLARTPDELRATDIPQRVFAELERSKVTDIHMLIRRGPGDTKFTPAELHQLSELADADVVLHGCDTIPEPDTGADKQARQVLQTLHDFRAAAPQGRSRRIHLRFYAAPTEIRGDRRVTEVISERTRPRDDGRVVGTGELTSLPAGMVVTAIGYRGSPIPGLPFDDANGLIPNEAGRVLGDDGPIAGVYVTGWLKRGPSGIIGTNKPDGSETAAAILTDLTERPAQRARLDVLDQLRDQRVHVVDWDGWLQLDTHESTLGLADGRERVKVADLDTMLQHCTPTSR